MFFTSHHKVSSFLKNREGDFLTLNLLEMYAIMASVKQMRLDVKKYIETADENVVKIMHALLKGDAPAD